MNKKIDKIIELLNEIRKENIDNVNREKEKIIDKLADDESTFFLIKKDFFEDGFKVYVTDVESYEEAMKTFSNLYENESDMILCKDEVKELLLALNKPTKLKLNSEDKDNAELV